MRRMWDEDNIIALGGGGGGGGAYETKKITLGVFEI